MKAIAVKGKLLWHVNLIGSNGETMMSSQRYMGRSTKAHALRATKNINDKLAIEKNKIVQVAPRGKQFAHTNSKGVTYYLNMKYVSLRGGELVPIYYFTKDNNRPEASPLPNNMAVNENPRNGFLTVKLLSTGGSSEN